MGDDLGGKAVALMASKACRDSGARKSRASSSLCCSRIFIRSAGICQSGIARDIGPRSPRLPEYPTRAQAYERERNRVSFEPGRISPQARPARMARDILVCDESSNSGPTSPSLTLCWRMSPRTTHVPKDKLTGAYNRAIHLERRRELAQLWADLILDGARPAGELLIGAAPVNTKKPARSGLLVDAADVA